MLWIMISNLNFVNQAKLEGIRRQILLEQNSLLMDFMMGFACGGWQRLVDERCAHLLAASCWVVNWFGRFVAEQEISSGAGSTGESRSVRWHKLRWFTWEDMRLVISF